MAFLRFGHGEAMQGLRCKPSGGTGAAGTRLQVTRFCGADFKPYEEQAAPLSGTPYPNLMRWPLFEWPESLGCRAKPKTSPYI